MTMDKRAAYSFFKKNYSSTYYRGKPLKLLGLLFFFFLVWPTDEVNAIRLKDLASVKGVRNNQLIGYGLVVGLNGTGDGKNTAFTAQGLANVMKNMGMRVNTESIKVKNVASVMITAKLPPFVKIGQTIDVTLSSLGDASSLQGGTLLATPLKGLDSQVCHGARTNQHRWL